MKQLLIAKLYSDDLMMILNQNDEEYRKEITLQLIDTLNYQALEYVKEKTEMCMEALCPTKKDASEEAPTQPHYTIPEEENDPCADCQYCKSGRCESYLPCMRKQTGSLADD